ncbi:MAG: hypothetical protein VB118_11150 [Oscillospiraceae bacterium]|nr:hypothetical protein [Oscillospiraceae bacterium]
MILNDMDYYMDNLLIKRVWEDIDFFEIEVIAQSKLIRASIRSYTTSEAINELAIRLSTFPKKNNDRYLWENGVKGNSSTPFLSLEIWCSDMLGHIIIEVYMELDDGGSYDKHNCCFFINTEVGLLQRFGKSLVLLNERGIAKQLFLNDDNHLRL